MEKLTILCIDDQPEVLDAVVTDLSEKFEPVFNVIECDSTFDAASAIEEIENNGDYLAVIVSDHVMPDRNGVDFLSSLNPDDIGGKAKKILLTGQATHKDTIKAINNRAIHQYIEKPWDKDTLCSVVRKLATEFIIAEGIDYDQFISENILDQDTILESAKKLT